MITTPQSEALKALDAVSEAHAMNPSLKEKLVDLIGKLSAVAGEPVDAANHDCLAKRRDGEPMFIILGRDPDGANIVRMWAERRLAAGGDADHCQLAFDTADRMREYASNPENRPASAPEPSAYDIADEPVAWRMRDKASASQWTYFPTEPTPCPGVWDLENYDVEPLYTSPKPDVTGEVNPDTVTFYDAAGALAAMGRDTQNAHAYNTVRAFLMKRHAADDTLLSRARAG